MPSTAFVAPRAAATWRVSRVAGDRGVRSSARGRGLAPRAPERDGPFLAAAVVDGPKYEFVVTGNDEHWLEVHRNHDELLTEQVVSDPLNTKQFTGLSALHFFPVGGSLLLCQSSQLEISLREPSGAHVTNPLWSPSYHITKHISTSLGATPSRGATNDFTVSADLLHVQRR